MYILQWYIILQNKDKTNSERPYIKSGSPQKKQRYLATNAECLQTLITKWGTITINTDYIINY